MSTKSDTSGGYHAKRGILAPAMLVVLGTVFAACQGAIPGATISVAGALPGDGEVIRPTPRFTIRPTPTPNRAPSAQLTITPATVPTGSAVTFDAAGSSDPEGSALRFEFSRGWPSTGWEDLGSTPRLQVTKDAPGSYQGAVRVTDSQGAVTLAQASWVVTNRPPTASIVVMNADMAWPNELIYVRVDISDPDGTVETTSWNFGPDVYYAEPFGSYPWSRVLQYQLKARSLPTTISVTVKDDYQAQTSATGTIVEAPR